MREAAELILNVQNTIISYGKYEALFYLSLLFLVFTNKEKLRERKVLLYSIVCLVFFWNPIFVGILLRFPGWNTYVPVLWVLPSFAVIAYALTLALQEMAAYEKKRNIYWGYLAASMLVIALAGTIVPYESDTVKAADNVYGIPAREMEVLERLDEETDPIVLLAPDLIMSVDRRYSGNIVNVYGNALWDSTVPNDNTDGYPQEYYDLYSLMQEPTGQEEEITKLAKKLGCTYLVVSNGRKEQEEAEIPRDPNQIKDLSVDVKDWCINGYTALDETSYYHILKYREPAK